MKYSLFKKLSDLINRHNLRLLCFLIRQGTILRIIVPILNHLQSRLTKKMYTLEEGLSLITRTPPLLSLPDTKPIDIIIPVYNGFEFLDRLFESIFNGTDVPFRLIIVEDCSTDERVLPFIEKICREHPQHAMLVKNSVNQGFVNSINIGFRYTDNHFAIVNTDIEVPHGWLTRLMNPIFKNKAIASTTPFSNAADIFSFPESPENTPILEGLSVDDIDFCFQHVRTGSNYVEIPTGVGFCMGINKAVADEIGMFDSTLFQHGYCEENDWSMRAKKAGYMNVLVTNLFVYHKQSGSFLSTGKQKQMEVNYWRLVAKHKEYLPAIFEFTLKNPLKQLREVLTMLITARTGSSKPVLMVGTFTDSIPQFEKTARLRYDQSLRKIILHYSYKGYISEMIVSDMKSLNRFVELFQVKEIIVGDLRGIPDIQETNRFLKRLQGACRLED